MINKINIDTIDTALEELNIENENLRKIASISKEAFGVSIPPAALVGAMTGATIANHQMRQELMNRQLENENSSVLSGNYYSQVQNIAQNLKIIFTPFGVIFVVKNASKEITIETIQTDEMNTSMYGAWQSKDAEYFKNMLLHKMHSEIQFVEQQFAKHIIEKQLGLQGQISKKASIDVDVDDLTISEIVDYTAKFKDLYGKHTEATEKLAEILVDSLEYPTQTISWKFQRPVEKYAFFENPLSFLGLNFKKDDLNSLQGQYLNPSYLTSRVKVGFLPDRVVFAVDNKMISSLLAIDMDLHAFENFQNQDKKFFVDYFEKEAKRGTARLKGKLPPNSDLIPIKKTASHLNIFIQNEIHPFVYEQFLTKKYTNEWMEWDFVALTKAIESDFNLENGIDDIALNKILSIAILNRSQTSYTSIHAFEKIIRSFTNKPIDFLEREDSDLTIFDLVFAIDAMDMVTPIDNIYDNFSREIFTYIIDILVQNNCKVFMPSELLESELKDEFYEQLNKYLLNAHNKRDTDSILDNKLESDVIQKNEIIHHSVITILKEIRKSEHIDVNKIRSMIDILKLPEYMKDIIKIQVRDNMILDNLLIKKSEILKEQLIDLGLAGEKS